MKDKMDSEPTSWIWLGYTHTGSTLAVGLLNLLDILWFLVPQVLKLISLVLFCAHQILQPRSGLLLAWTTRIIVLWTTVLSCKHFYEELACEETSRTRIEFIATVTLPAMMIFLTITEFSRPRKSRDQANITKTFFHVRTMLWRCKNIHKRALLKLLEIEKVANC